MSTNLPEAIDPLRDEEIALNCANLTLYVSPWGASLRGLVADGVTEIVTRYRGSGKVGGQGDVLIPFPGRVRGGKYVFDGVEYQMHVNDAEGPNAIHGFLRMRPWSIVEQTEQSVTFAIDLSETDAPGYPFPLHVEVSYEVSPSGFFVHYSVQNTGTIDAPIAAGFHPYFSVGAHVIDDCALTVPFGSIQIFDSGLLPTGEIVAVQETKFDFKEEKIVSSTVFNTCYLNPIRNERGDVVISLRSPDAGRVVRVIMGPEIDYVVLYSGDPLPESHRRKSLAIEPMSCGADAFNHPEWGLAVVKPGELLRGRWAVEYETR